MASEARVLARSGGLCGDARVASLRQSLSFLLKLASHVGSSQAVATVGRLIHSHEAVQYARLKLGERQVIGKLFVIEISPRRPSAVAADGLFDL